MARRRYKKKYYKKRTYSKKRSDNYEGFFIAVLGVGALVGVAGNEAFSQLPSFVTDITVAIGALLLLGILVWIALNLQRFIKLVTKRQKHRKKVDQQYEEAVNNKSFGHLDWEQFEHFAGDVFRKQGYKVEVTQAQHDKGVDAHMVKDGKSYLMQAKFYKVGNNVGGPATREFAGTILGHDGGFLVTTSDFTPDAYEYAATNPRLTLINGDKLRQMMDAS